MATLTRLPHESKNRNRLKIIIMQPGERHGQKICAIMLQRGETIEKENARKGRVVFLHILPYKSKNRQTQNPHNATRWKGLKEDWQ